MSYRKIFHLKVVKVNQSSESTLKLSVVWDTNFSPFIICKIEFGSKAKKHTPVATSQEYFPSFSERHRRWLEGFSWLWNVSSIVKTILKKRIPGVSLWAIGGQHLYLAPTPADFTALFFHISHQYLSWKLWNIK